MTSTPERTNDYKPGDRVLALITWGSVLGPCEHDADRLLVHLDTGYIQSFHWAECYHECDVAVRDEDEPEYPECTCLPTCNRFKCKGKCGCRGCEVGYMNFLSGE